MSRRQQANQCSLSIGMLILIDYVGLIFSCHIFKEKLLMV